MKLCGQCINLRKRIALNDMGVCTKRPGIKNVKRNADNCKAFDDGKGEPTCQKKKQLIVKVVEIVAKAL